MSKLTIQNSEACVHMEIHVLHKFFPHFPPLFQIKVIYHHYGSQAHDRKMVDWKTMDCPSDRV